MIVYRIERGKYLDATLSGLGAAVHGGRWNEKNVPAIYASSSRSLALLEILVHLKSTQFMPRDRFIVSIEISETQIVKNTSRDLPDYWNTIPHPSMETKKLFASTCFTGSHCAMTAPSVVVPEEYDVVINPLHIEFQYHVKIVNIEPLIWDPRLS